MRQFLSLCLIAFCLLYSACLPQIIHLQDAVSHKSLSLSLSLAILGGLFTALSPCVYPLIPITLSIIGARAYQSHLHGFLVASVYVLGMSLVYCLLGIVFAYLGILAGSLMQSSLVMIAIAVIFGLMALSMFGIFNLMLPPKILDKVSRIGGQGYKGAFLMGLVAGIIAAPCTGPVLGFILTIIAKKQDLYLGIALMWAFSLGLGLPFLLLGTFSQALARLPKSGAWMNKIKYFLGIAMLATSFYYFYLALSPVIVTKLKVEHDLDWHILNSENSKISSFADLLKQAKILKTPVMLDFYADWCIACHEYENKTFSDNQVKSMLANYFLIKIDSTKSSKHLEKIQTHYGINGLPTIIFLDSDGQLLANRALGFLSPDDFISLIKSLKLKP